MPKEADVMIAYELFCKPVITAEQRQLVGLVENHPITTSLQVAEKFEKDHDNVLRDIRNLECSEDFRLLNFEESSYTNKQGREMPMFTMTRDGFAFLALGFTGKAAAEWKEKYIAAFNAMEAELLNRRTYLHQMELAGLRIERDDVIRKLERVEAAYTALRASESKKLPVFQMLHPRGGQFRGCYLDELVVLAEDVLSALDIRRVPNKSMLLQLRALGLDKGRHVRNISARSLEMAYGRAPGYVLAALGKSHKLQYVIAITVSGLALLGRQHPDFADFVRDHVLPEAEGLMAIYMELTR